LWLTGAGFRLGWPGLGLIRAIVWLYRPRLRLIRTIIWLNRPGLRLIGTGFGLGWPCLRLAGASRLYSRTILGLNCWAIALGRAGSWLSRAIFRHSGAVRLHSGDGTSDRGDGAGRCDQGRPALVYVVELLTILRGLSLVLQLRGHGRNTGTSIGYEFGRLRSNVDASTATVV
jgi:hypothetical protein